MAATPSLSSVDCDFKTSDLCGYRQVTNEGMNWTRLSGPTPSDGTGPLTDHTLNNDQECGDDHSTPRIFPGVDASQTVCRGLTRRSVVL
ncbi:hypothetical protein ACOMHN_053397 [Nucella lapillus]